MEAAILSNIEFWSELPIQTRYSILSTCKKYWKYVKLCGDFGQIVSIILFILLAYLTTMQFKILESPFDHLSLYNCPIYQHLAKSGISIVPLHCFSSFLIIG